MVREKVPGGDSPTTGEIRMLLWDTQQGLIRGDISNEQARAFTKACRAINMHLLKRKPSATCTQNSEGHWCVRLLDGTIVAKFGRDGTGSLIVLAV